MKHATPLLAAAVAALGWSAACAGGAGVSDLVGQVSQSDYRNYLDNFLYTHTGQTRYYSAEHDLARGNIQSILTGFGLNTALDPFVYNSSTYYNVVATQVGKVTPERIYIIGAHYDSVNCPGADDNASGVAGILEIASVLAQQPLKSTVIYVAFDREEQGMKGSWAYANAHSADDIRGMISMDMIAFNDPTATNQAYLYGRTASNPIKTQLQSALSTYGNLTGTIAGQLDASDHAPFEAYGKQACLLIERHTNNTNYHKTTDSVDTPNYIDYDYATRMSKSVTGWLAGTAAAWAVPEWTTAGGNWSAGVNWTTGSPTGANEWAILPAHGGPARAITLDSPTTLGTLRITGVGIYALGGTNTLTLDATTTAQIDIDNTGGSAQHTIACPVGLADAVSIHVASGASLSLDGAIDNSAGRTLTKTGPGSLTMAGAQTHGVGAALSLEGGATTLAADCGSTAVRPLSISVASTASLSLAADQHAKSLSIANGGNVAMDSGGHILALDTLELAGDPGAWTGRLDVNDGYLIVSAGTQSADVLATLTSQLKSGYNLAGPLWSGNGIRSTAAQLDSAMGLGILANDDGTGQPLLPIFAGEAVAAGDVLVAYTRMGDANLDGQVSISDFMRLQAGFGTSSFGARGSWYAGDFDYSGVVDLADFAILAGNLSQSLSPADRQLLDSFAASHGVPEPGVMGILLTAWIGLSRRHRVKLGEMGEAGRAGRQGKGRPCS